VGHLIAIPLLEIKQVYSRPRRLENHPLAINSIFIVNTLRFILIDTGSCIVGDIQALPCDVPHIPFIDLVQHLLGIPSNIEDEQRIFAEVADNLYELKKTLIAESKLENSPFKISDMSIKRAIDSDWKAYTREKNL
jgi:hypothetical protein